MKRVLCNEVTTTVVSNRLIYFPIEMVHFRPNGFGGFPPYILHRLLAHTLGHYYGYIYRAIYTYTHEMAKLQYNTNT